MSDEQDDGWSIVIEWTDDYPDYTIDMSFTEEAAAQECAERMVKGMDHQRVKRLRVERRTPPSCTCPMECTS